MEWKPFDTAPKDGTEFLAYYPEGKWVENLEDENDLGRCEAVVAIVRYDDRGYLEGNTYFLTPNGTPTLWGPCPSPSIGS